MKQATCLTIFYIFILCFSTRTNAQFLALEETAAPEAISLAQAFERTMLYEAQLKLAKNRLQQHEAQKISRIASLVPKLKGSMRYTRNIPEIKANLGQNGQAQSLLYRKLAGLLSANGDQSGAQQLESTADMLMRRSSGQEIITRPKDSIDATLSLEIPIFNGQDLARLFAINDSIKLEEAKVLEQQANTIYAVAHAYLLATHKEGIVELRKMQQKTGLESQLKIRKQYRTGLIKTSDQLRSLSASASQDTALATALLEYNNAKAELAMLIGQTKDFNIIHPEKTLFEILDKDEASLIDLATRIRPDLRAQQQAFKLAGRERLGGVLQFLPIVSLQADANYTTNTSGLFSESTSYAFFLNASYLFFSGGSRYGILKESALKKEAETIRLEELQQKIPKLIRGRIANLKLKEITISAKNAELKFATENNTQILSEYNQGLVEFDKVLEAQQLLFDASVNQQKAQADHEEEQLKLAFDVGLLSPHLVAR